MKRGGQNTQSENCKRERERESERSKVSCIAPLEGIKIIADSIQTKQEPKSTDV